MHAIAPTGATSLKAGVDLVCRGEPACHIGQQPVQVARQVGTLARVKILDQLCFPAQDMVDGPLDQLMSRRCQRNYHRAAGVSRGRADNQASVLGPGDPL